MSDRPDYVHCIVDTHQDNIGKSLCGRTVGWAEVGPSADPHLLRIRPGATEKRFRASEFCFQSVDHWFHNARSHGRLLGCSTCVARIQLAAAENQAGIPSPEYGD